MIKRIFFKDIKPGEDIMVKRSSDSFPEQERAVEDIYQNIHENRDKALFDYTKRFDGAEIDAGSIKVSKAEIDEAYDNIDKELLATIKAAAANIRDYHKLQVQKGFMDESKPGIALGQKVTPIEKVGVYVPGGKASYPSTVLMDIIPASVAGVEKIYMVSPPGKDGKLSPQIICAGMEAGVSEIFKIGGAQAVFALALGTESVPRVDKIVGPGNIFVTLAKRKVFGMVGLDSIAGPSEICVLADESADPTFIAADMFSQAEHDEMASAVLVTDSEALANKVEEKINEMLPKEPRSEIINKSLETYGLIVICEDIHKAVEAVNNVAPEHLEVMTKNPKNLLDEIKNAGAIFLGEFSSEPLGDYYAGPSHVLPTNGTARFFSPLGVYDFIKRSSVIYYDKDAFLAASDDVIRFATAEGLHAHANSVKVRKDKYEGK